MDNLDAILAYLEGEMTVAEVAAFEQRMAAEPELAAQVAEMRDLVAGIHASGEEKMRANLRDITRQPIAAEKSRTSGRLKWLLLAVLLGVGAFFWWNKQAEPVAPPAPPTPPPVVHPMANEDSPNTTAPEKPAPANDAEQNKRRYLALAESHYATPSFSGMRNADPGRAPLDTALMLFRVKKYAETINWVNTHQFDAKWQPDANELRAHAYLSTHRYAQARKAFEAIVAAGQMPYAESAEYYLLLCYLADYQSFKPKFDALLQKILKDSGHPDWERAKKLRADM